MVFLSRVSGPGLWGLLVFMGWVISYANKWEDYSVLFGGRDRDFQELGPYPFFRPFMISLGTVLAPVVHHLAANVLP